MRTIKFRVWSEVDKEMTSHEKIRILPEERNLSEVFEDDSVIWMQFTGLLDKNGKEVYEGDVLDYEGNKGRRSRSGKREPFDNYHIVHFSNGAFCVKGFNGDFPVSPNLNIRSNWEVIGNIHENPELL